MTRRQRSWLIFFFNDTATTEIYTLSLHDALPIYQPVVDEVERVLEHPLRRGALGDDPAPPVQRGAFERSEEHTSELQSRQYLVCRLLLEQKNQPPLRDRATFTPSFAFG